MQRHRRMLLIHPRLEVFGSFPSRHGVPGRPDVGSWAVDEEPLRVPRGVTEMDEGDAPDPRGLTTIRVTGCGGAGWRCQYGWRLTFLTWPLNHCNVTLDHP